MYKPQTATTRREYNELRKSVKNGSGKTSYRAADLIRRFRDGNRDNSDLFGRKQRGANNYDKFDSESVERKRNSNGGRTPENVRNDQLQEGLNADSRKPKSIDDTGLRISDNSILVESENDSKYQYKYVVYDDMEDGPVIRDVYAIGRIDPNVEDDVASLCHNIARYIRDVEELKYDNTKQHESVLGTCIQDTSYLLARYNNRSKRFYVIGRGSVENG